MNGREREVAMDQFAITVSLFALVACLGHAGWLAYRLVAGRRLPSRSSSIFVNCVVGGALLLALWSKWWAGDYFSLPTAGLITVSLLAAIWLGLRLARSPASTIHSNLRPGRTFAVGQLLLAAAATGIFYVSIDQPTSDFPAVQPFTKVPIDDAVVVTDQGRIFSVFRYQVTPASDAALEVYQRKVLRVALPDATSNCHGWVFASGRYGLSEPAVEALLQDNGYQPVAAPQPGDVIVYRDDAGKILHSGRVRSAHENGQIWIESKWGAGGRYIHLPENQCYSASYRYYRSSRPTHEVQVVRTPVTGDSRVASTDDAPVSPERS